MSSHDGKPKRSWQEIAAEAAREQDPQRLLELTQELERALDECNKRAVDSEKPKSRRESA
jgi:hypothetical protein